MVRDGKVVNVHHPKVEVWILARHGLTGHDGRSYGYTNLVLKKENGELMGLRTYSDDFNRENKVGLIDSPERIMEKVENFNPKGVANWMPPLDLAVKTEIPEKKAKRILRNYNMLVCLQQQIKNLQEKAKKLENTLYDEIEGIYREKAEQFRKEIEE